MPLSPAPAEASGTALAGLTVSVALLASNALGYVSTVLAARTLVPTVFGELAVLLGVAVIGTVPATAVQTVVALRVAAGARADRHRRLHLVGVAVAAATALAVLLLSPLLSTLLHLPGPGTLVAVAALLVPTTVVAVHDGILQGARRYRRLATVAVGFGAAKTAGGVAALLWVGSPTGVVAGMATGATAGAVVTWTACGRPGLARDDADTVRDVARAAAGLLGFVVLWNLDVLLARATLSPADAGLYALGSVIFKVAFWLPQGVGVVMLPLLVDRARRPAVVTRSVLLVVGLGAPLVLGVAALGPRLSPLLCGGAACGAVASIGWLFAVLGTVTAAAGLLVQTGIAGRDGRTAVTVWSVIAAECAVAAPLGAAGVLSPWTLCVLAVTGAVALVVVESARGRAGSPLGQGPARDPSGGGPAHVR